MKSQDISFLRIPDVPGVYFFRDAKGKILYIGKATSLRSRVKSYFNTDTISTRGLLIVEMVEKSKRVTWEVTGSVLEALILENSLIKKYKPAFNTKEKDDKSYSAVIITKEEYPRVLLVRTRDIKTENTPAWTHMFGPFPSGGQLKEALKLIRGIFPFRDKCEPDQGVPCFHAQLGLCPGVCIGKINKKEYGFHIKNLILFFEGKTNLLEKKLKKEMKESARAHNFEHAARVRNTLYALKHIQDVALIREEEGVREVASRIESFDVAHHSGSAYVGAMVVLLDGRLAKGEYRKFKIRTKNKSDDTGALQEMLERRLNHTEWPLPSLIVMDGGKAQRNVALRVLQERNIDIPVVSVVKDEKHRPKDILGPKEYALKHRKEILLANAETHRFAIEYHRLLRRKSIRG